jgi:hypothetical protein
MVEWKLIVEIIVIIATVVVILLFFLFNYQNIASQFFEFLDKAIGWVFR